jgi:hypothetical protein
MSVSYSAGVILGVRIAEIGLKVERISTNFEIHDKKGKPTGKFDQEVSWKISYNGQENIEEGERFYNVPSKKTTTSLV